MRNKMIAGSVGAVLAIAMPMVALWEGKSNEAYLDPVGIPTACYGYTHGVELGQLYTDAECRALLVKELEYADAVIDLHVRVALPKDVRAAYVSFIYNVGQGAFARSTLLRKTNAGDVEGACHELPRWVYARGQKLRGLVRRRAAEKRLCLKGVRHAALGSV